MDISEKVRLEEGFWFSPQADYIVFLTINSTKVICNLEKFSIFQGKPAKTVSIMLLPQVLHRLQNKEKPMQTTFTLRFGSLKMIFECSIARCDVGLGRAIVQCQKNPLRKPKLSINRAILSAHFSAVKFCIGFFCWIGFFWFCIGFFCNWMLQLLLKIVAKNLNYASLHVCT